MIYPVWTGFGLTSVEGASAGVYGRCWHPVGRGKGYRLSLQVPGPFPGQTIVRRRPIYVVDGVRSRPLLPEEFEGEHIIDHKTGVVKRWIRVRAHTQIHSMDDAIVWLGAHEAYHFLRRSKQIPGRQGEIEADEHADRMLAEFMGDAVWVSQGYMIMSPAQRNVEVMA
jgi:hypothetical protein